VTLCCCMRRARLLWPCLVVAGSLKSGCLGLHAAAAGRRACILQHHKQAFVTKQGPAGRRHSAALALASLPRATESHSPPGEGSSALEQRSPTQHEEPANLQLELGSSSPAVWSTLLLNGVTVIWGTQHAVLKMLLEDGCSPALVNAVRFGVAATLLTVWTPPMTAPPKAAPAQGTRHSALHHRP
jgi:hypothetical protein